MRRLPTVFALLAASVAEGCGGQSAAEKLLVQRRGFCEASIGTTVGALSQQWGYPPNAALDCESEPNLLATPNGSCDRRVPICRLVWQEFFAIDSSVCGTNGCTYKCDAFAPAPAGAGPGTPVTGFQDQVICSARFAQGQP